MEKTEKGVGGGEGVYLTQEPPRKLLNVVNLETTLQDLSEQVGHVRALVDDMESLDRQLKRVRQRIVVWCSKVNDINEALPEPLAYGLCSMIEEARDVLKRKYYTLGEQFVPINVAKEMEDVIPF